MSGLLLALCLTLHGPTAPRIGPPSPDTEIVGQVWISDLQRWGVGVIRGGRFVAVAPTESPSESPPESPSDSGASAGDTLNYGLLMEGIRGPSQQGYRTNDKGFVPPTHAAPTHAGDGAPPRIVPAALVALALSLTLAALLILIAKGCHR